MTHTGSNLHALKALQYPRWEDYEYERADEEENSLYWLGDGQTWNEKHNTGDSTSIFGCCTSWQPRVAHIHRFRGLVPDRGVR